MEDRQQSALSWSLRMLRRVGSEADLSVTVSAIRDHYKFSHLAFLVVRRATPETPIPSIARHILRNGRPFISIETISRSTPS